MTTTNNPGDVTGPRWVGGVQSEKETPAAGYTLSTEDEAAHFIRIYDPCPECLGWDERFEGRNTTFDGYRTNGEVVQGRSNHRRNCNRSGSEGRSSDV